MTDERRSARAEAAGDHDETSSIRSLFAEDTEPAVEGDPALQAIEFATHGPPPGPPAHREPEQEAWLASWRSRFEAASLNQQTLSVASGSGV